MPWLSWLSHKHPQTSISFIFRRNRCSSSCKDHWESGGSITLAEHTRIYTRIQALVPCIIYNIRDPSFLCACVITHNLHQFTGSGMPSCRSWAIRSVAFSLATACRLESLDNQSVLNPHASTWVWNQVAQSSSFVKVCQDQDWPTKQYMFIMFTHCMPLSHVRQFTTL